MRKLSYILTFTLTALLLAACSEDDILQSSPLGETEEAGSVPVTFTATMDYSIEEIGGGAAKAVSTRATADVDDAPTRFFGQALSGTTDVPVLSDVVEGVLNGNTYTFTFEKLKLQTEYTYMFWADNATGDNPTDLRAVPYSAGNVAFAAKVSGTPVTVSKTVGLKHVVSKVTLRHNSTNAFTAAAGDNLTLTVPYLTSYDVSADTQSGSSNTTTISHSFAGDVNSTNYDVCSFYTIAPAGNNNSITVGFNLVDLAITSLSLPANARVTLQGDLSEYNTNWTIQDGHLEEYIQQRLNHYFAKDGSYYGIFSINEYVYYGTKETLIAIIKNVLRENYTGRNAGTVELSDGTTINWNHGLSSHGSIWFEDGNYRTTLMFTIYSDSRLSNFPAVTY